eukprot:240360-Pleurochrysis_carterae.AAC.1
MSAHTQFNANFEWTYEGEHAVSDESKNHAELNKQYARIGNQLIADVYNTVTLLGVNPDGSFAVRKQDNEIVDSRTRGHLRREVVRNVNTDSCVEADLVGKVPVLDPEA